MSFFCGIFSRLPDLILETHFTGVLMKLLVFFPSFLFLNFACTACDPLPMEELGGAGQSGERLNLQAEELDFNLGTHLLSFSFEQKEKLITGSGETLKKQQGQMKFSFQTSGDFSLCAVLHQEKKISGDFEKAPGFPKGVTDMKIDDRSALVVVHGYTGSWHREGAWAVGTVERRAMPSCKEKSLSYDGRRFWCTVVDNAPSLAPRTMICGWEKAPLGSGWMSTFLPEELSVPLELPASIQGFADELIWLVMGSKDGLRWTWQGSKSVFSPEKVDFKPEQFKIKEP